jgi:deazaflavin-dependent oxidoreductase (nitroreductase family)
MAHEKGLYGKLTSSTRPPRPGTLGFKAWTAITRLNTVAYRLSGGRVGGTFDRAPVLLLHHVGRKSGEERVAPLIYLPDGDDLVIVASYGGAPKHPAWFHNVTASPDTTVELGRERRPVVAHVATAEERARLWPTLIGLYPAFADYQARSEGREIPLVVLKSRQPA